MLARVSIGWTWLERTLNGIIDQLNRQKPLQSATIAIEESPNGTLLKYVGATQSDQSSGGGAGANPTGGQWTAIVVVDPNTCIPSTLMVWAKPTS
jgi:hypothetical protein